MVEASEDPAVAGSTTEGGEASSAVEGLGEGGAAAASRLASHESQQGAGGEGSSGQVSAAAASRRASFESQQGEGGQGASGDGSHRGSRRSEGAASASASASQPCLAIPEDHAAAAEAPEAAASTSEPRNKKMGKSDSCPGPGDYMWNDEVNLRKKPVWSMTSPDRKNLDLMLTTWTPASTSTQPRAPDPGEYSLEGIGRHGKFSPPKWSWKKKHDVPQQPASLGLKLELPSHCGGKHPASHSNAVWTLHGADRKYLPAETPTWTPMPPTEFKPGPGTYDLGRTPKWKASSRKGTFGGRQANLHPDEKAWVPKTRGAAMIPGGEAIRLNPPMASPKLRPMFTPHMLLTQSRVS